MKKKVLTALVVSTVLIVPFSVFAATSDATAAKSVRSFFGVDTSKLTDTQKADVKEYTDKLADLQKNFIDKMVKNGTITKEQGDARQKSIDEMLQKSQKSGIIPGFETGREGHYGKGGRGDFGLGQLDTSKLTADQKTGVIDSYKKMVTLQKEHIDKLVTNNLMTKEQGDSAKAKIDTMIKDIETNGLSGSKGMFFGGFGKMGGFEGFGMKEKDNSTLTDQQKAIFTDYSKKMSDLQKELINKFVTYGLITKEQGDLAINRLDNAGKFQQENNFHGKSRMGNRKGQNNSETNTTTSSNTSPS